MWRCSTRCPRGRSPHCWPRSQRQVSKLRVHQLLNRRLMQLIVRGHTSTVEARQGRLGERTSLSSAVQLYARRFADSTLITNGPQSSLRERAKKNINTPHLLTSFQPLALFWGTVSFASTVNALCVLSFDHDGRVGSFTTRFSSRARPSCASSCNR